MSEQKQNAVHGVNWSRVQDAYGPAIEVPDLLVAVWSPDQDARREAYEGLASRLVHQGSRSPASAIAVPFLAALVADADAPDRWAAAELLAAIAISDKSYWLTESPNIAEMRREVTRKAALSPTEWSRNR